MAVLPIVMIIVNHGVRANHSENHLDAVLVAKNHHNARILRESLDLGGRVAGIENMVCTDELRRPNKKKTVIPTDQRSHSMYSPERWSGGEF